RSYEGTDVGVMLCHPNPEHPDRMVALIAGTTPGALYQAYDRFGAHLWPGRAGAYHWFDYAVYDARAAGLETLPVVGFFDNRWRLRPPEHVGGGAAAWTSRPAARERTAPQHFPPLGSAADAEAGEVCLSDVRPMRIRQPAGAVGFDRGFRGEPIPAGRDETVCGLGVAPPSELSFRLDGAFAQFSGRAAVSSGGTCRFEVLGDGRSLATTGPLQPLGEDGEWADLQTSIRGVQVLTLRCRPADADQPAHGSCVWAEPVVRRAATR
ncbi:MAG: NPCBM/NEW2 domain-containing protein, partial [Candidatus Brocadiia bacterium]